MSILIAIIGLGLLVVVHEAGHFFTALAVGMRPRKFYVGFPPALVKKTRNGIEYGLGATLLGGYVKIPGMHRPAPSDADAYFGHAVRKTAGLVGAVERLKRSLTIEDHEQAVADLSDLEAAADRAGVEAAVERGVGELRDTLAPDAYWRQRTWKKVAVILAGPASNILLAMVLFALVFMVAGGKATRTVQEVLANHPAQSMGLQPGDKILAINSRPVTPSQIVDRIESSQGRPLTVTVKRAGQVLALGPAVPRKDQGLYRLGFRLRGARLSLPEAAWESIKLTGVVMRETVKSLGRIVHKQGRKQISSPVGIVKESSVQARYGWEYFLLVEAFISLSLGLVNLLPLLPLDGGHIAFSLVEGLRGRAVTRQVYERASAVGWAFVLLLLFIGLSNDVGRLGGG